MDLPLQTVHLWPIKEAMRMHAPLGFCIHGDGLSRGSLQ